MRAAGDAKVDVVRIDATARVAGGWLGREPQVVRSPLTGEAGVAIVIEVLARREGDPLPASLGAVVIGDRLSLVLEPTGLVLDVVARRARFEGIRGAPKTLDALVPEVVPIVATSRHGGLLGYRELVVRAGDALRVRAVVEGVGEGRLVARDERAPVVLELLAP